MYWVYVETKELCALISKECLRIYIRLHIRVSIGQE